MIPKDLKEILGGVEKTKIEANAAVEHAALLAKSELEDLQAKILSGEETTGSYLHDCLVALYGTILIDYPQITPNYERVEADLKNSQPGQPVVIIKRSLVDTFHSPVPPIRPAEKTISSVVMVARLNDARFMLNNESKMLALPVDSYAREEGSKRMVVNNWIITGSSEPAVLWGLGDRFDLGIDLGAKLDMHNVEPSLNRYSAMDDMLTVAAGSKAIEAWLSTNDGAIGDLLAIRRLCNLLGITPVEPVTAYQQIASRTL